MAEICLCSLVLEIGAEKEVSMEISEGAEIELQITEETEASLEMGAELIIGGLAPEYEGPCEVTPKINAKQTLQTRDMLMPDDVTVHQITVAEVSNPQGGKTVTIGIV